MTSRERDFPFSLTRDASDGSDGLTFEGYAAVFNSPTRINDQDGEYDEVIAPGAFKRSIQNTKPVLMFDHGRHPLIGQMPLGQITHLEEDERGLFVRARLSDNWLIQPVRDAVAAGAIDGMSFRFEPKKDTWTRQANGPKLRTLREVRMPELGPVVFPAYADTTASVRSAVITLQERFPDAVILTLPTRDDVTPDATDVVDPEDDATSGEQTPQIGSDVRDVLAALWGVDCEDIEMLELGEDQAVFIGRGSTASDHVGLWSVNYSLVDGELVVDAPQQVSALQPRSSEPVVETPEAATTQEEDMPDGNESERTSDEEMDLDLDTSEELVDTDTSDELVAQELEDTSPADRMNADRAAQLRYLALSRHGVI